MEIKKTIAALALLPIIAFSGTGCDNRPVRTVRDGNVHLTQRGADQQYIGLAEEWADDAHNYAHLNILLRNGRFEDAREYLDNVLLKELADLIELRDEFNQRRARYMPRRDLELAREMMSERVSDIVRSRTNPPNRSLYNDTGGLYDF